ncbi:hypothetical protein ACFY2N_27555 [Streptomyces rubiginosohelvolus]|uniref:hypothetical protein n=1 Tax=Streptomyces rubiginosohelvolus TaxID=67362 RepID=UPI0036AEC055
MSVPDEPFAAFQPDTGPRSAATPSHLLATTVRLRTRLTAVNVGAAGGVIVLSWIVQDGLAARVAGPLTLGMGLIALYVLTLAISAIWFDRACARHLDPSAGNMAAEGEER